MKVDWYKLLFWQSDRSLLGRWVDFVLDHPLLWVVSLFVLAALVVLLVPMLG